MVETSKHPSELQLLSEDIYRYRTVSVSHLQDMQKYMDTLRKEGLFSSNKVFRSFVDDKKFNLLENFKDAKFIIVIAVYLPLASVNVPFQGRFHKVLIPPNYYVQNFTTEQLRATIARNINGLEGYRIEDVRNDIFLKHLAVRSGLAEYGRNNICYVQGMGSMLSLFAFYTDYIFEENHWGEIRMMDSCSDCRLCINQCPTHAISDTRFIIDVEKCLPLYNEIIGEIPRWIPLNAHNALMGCMHCQLKCPANKEVISQSIEFEPLTERETYSVLENLDNDETVSALCHKFKISTPEFVTYYRPVISRNLKMLLEAR
jgi:epoxyqueuosine reductase